MGQWYHVAGTYDGTEIRVYINGNLEGSRTAPVSEPLVTSTLPTGIGHLPNWSVQWFEGIIDEVRVYGRALTPEEIAEHAGLEPEGDIDNEGLLNGWEAYGVDVDGDGTVDLDLPALGADPLHKDIFVEIDAMVGRAPTQAALDRVADAFAAVPDSLVTNPDGLDGITLHVQLDETDIPLADWPNAFVEFDNVKNNRFGTPAERDDSNWSNIRDAKRMVYRYCIFANRYRLVRRDGSVTWRSSGLAERPGDDFMVTLGGWSVPGGTEDQQIGTFMHELGHNLNLHHGGDNPNCFKPNYHSVMNYHWQVPHWNHTGWVLDYSREVLPTLDESNLNENAGIGGILGNTVPVGPLPVWIANESGPVDWNRDFDTTDNGVVADITHVRVSGLGGPSPGQVLTGHNDWPVLWYELGGHANFQDGVHDENTIPEEITYEENLEIYGAQPVADAGLDQTVFVGTDCLAEVTLDGSDSNDAGDDLIYTWFLDGQEFAYGVNPTIELPLGNWSIELVVNDGIGDSEPDYVVITVEDNTPPELTVSVTPEVLWPANHKMVLITPTLRVSDNCDESPEVTLVSISSNEDDDSKGDGHTTDDIQISANGSIYLRAERSGKGSGRVYTITYQAVDDAGNVVVDSATVTVPHDRR